MYVESFKNNAMNEQIWKTKQKIETSQRGEWYNEIAQKSIRPHPRKEMSHAYSVKQSEDICKTLNALQLGEVLSDVYLEHLKVIIHSTTIYLVRFSDSQPESWPSCCQSC